MLVVVLAAECLALYSPLHGWIDQRSQDFSALAREHWRIAHVSNHDRIIYKSNTSATFHDPRQAAHHRAMAVKYDWATRHPWLPVWPDPPEPE